MASPVEHLPPPEAATLVGRDRELTLLRDRLAAALGGHGGLVLIGGEAGIGKTALAEALCSEAAGRGALVLVGRCYDLSETPPYGPWAEALARVALRDGLPAPPDLAGGGGVNSQSALFAAVRDYLAGLSARQPLVLLLDDVHWADDASLDLLRVLGRGLADLPLLLLATYRSDELTRRHPLYQLLPVLVREVRAVRLDPRPLDADGLRTLVRGRYALPDADAGRLIAYLAARAEGNPFFTGELLRALEEGDSLRPGAQGGWALGDLAAMGVPPLLRQVIDGRVARLGEGAGRLLGVAAVIGPVVPLDLWAAVSAAPEAALLEVIERATEARLLTELLAAGGYRFAHALIRGALYEGLALPRRRAWHRRTGDLLAASPAPDPVRVAHHFRLAGDPRAAEWLIKAGEGAQRAYAWLTAADRYEAALALLEQRAVAPRERARLLATIAQFHRYNAPDRAITALDEAVRLAAAAGDAPLAAAFRFDRGHILAAHGDTGAGLPAMLAAFPLLDALPQEERATLPAPTVLGAGPEEPYHRGVLLFQLANAGRLAEVETYGAGLEAGTPRATKRGLAARALMHALRGQPEEAERDMGAALAIDRAREQHAELLIGLRYRLQVLILPYWADHAGQRQQIAAEVTQIVAPVRAVYPAASVAAYLLPLALLAGQWADAVTPTLPYWEAHLGYLAHWQGDRERAWAYARMCLPHGAATPPGDRFFLTSSAALRLGAELLLDAGSLPEARSWLEAHDRLLAWSGAVLGRAEGQLGWASYHRVARVHSEARQAAERALAHATEPRQPLALLAAHRLLGELDTDAGRYADAAAHLDSALALADACAARYERALTLLALAELRVASGGQDDARALSAEARTILTPLEARPALARADALTARLAADATPPAVLPAGLSAREAEVLRLVAQGLTNAQVAERLFLSPRTIDQHLRSIYNKIGVDNRTAASRFATERGLA